MSHTKLGKDWTEILLSYPKFIDFISNTLISGVTADDLLLQTVMLVGNISSQGQCASLIESNSYLILEIFQPILSLFLAREYDPQFISQLLYAIYCFLFHGIGMQTILSEGEVLMRIIQLIDDPNQGLRQINDDVLTLLRQTDDIQLA